MHFSGKGLGLTLAGVGAIAAGIFAAANGIDEFKDVIDTDDIAETFEEESEG